MSKTLNELSKIVLIALKKYPDSISDQLSFCNGYLIEKKGFFENPLDNSESFKDGKIFAEREKNRLRNYK